MVAVGIGVVVAGAAVLLLPQAATEERRGLADMSVEESAYVLQANISSCLRSMSCGGGMTPNLSTAAYDANHNLLGYQQVFCFLANTNGTYTTASIQFIPTTGQVLYTPNVSAPSAQLLWMTNGPTVALQNLCFSTSFNMDGSQDSSLVNVLFQMSDNGFSQQNPTNNPASIYRSFSIQMRSD
jgi:hypothetical protein